jgi:hypothetical protein
VGQETLVGCKIIVINILKAELRCAFACPSALRRRFNLDHVVDDVGHVSQAISCSVSEPATAPLGTYPYDILCAIYGCFAEGVLSWPIAGPVDNFSSMPRSDPAVRPHRRMNYASHILLHMWHRTCARCATGTAAHLTADGTACDEVSSEHGSLQGTAPSRSLPW